MSDTTTDPGSFRDRHARVFSYNGDIYRGLSGPAHTAWRQLSGSALFDRFTRAGSLVGTREVPLASVPPAQGWTAVLQHDRIPFISYPVGREDPMTQRLLRNWCLHSDTTCSHRYLTVH